MGFSAADHQAGAGSGRPGPGQDNARQITREEALAARLPQTAVLMADPVTGMVTFWERTKEGKLKSLALGYQQARDAREKLEELWKRPR